MRAFPAQLTFMEDSCPWYLGLGGHQLNGRIVHDDWWIMVDKWLIFFVFVAWLINGSIEPMVDHWWISGWSWPIVDERSRIFHFPDSAGVSPVVHLPCRQSGVGSATPSAVWYCGNGGFQVQKKWVTHGDIDGDYSGWWWFIQNGKYCSFPCWSITVLDHLTEVSTFEASSIWDTNQSGISGPRYGCGAILTNKWPAMNNG